MDRHRDRCAEAGIGEEVEFATKPELARRMLQRLLVTTAERRCRGSPRTRPTATTRAAELARRAAAHYVMAVSCDARFATPTGPHRADELAASAPTRGWQRLFCGQGSKGHRLYDWPLVDPGADQHLLLVRRSITKPNELAYYLCRSTTPVPLAELVRVAGSRWAVEETFPFTKNETCLDHYQTAATTPGTGTSPYPCSPPRSSPSPPTPNEPTIKKGRHS